VPLTLDAPLESVKVEPEMVEAVIASLKVAVTFGLEMEMPVAAFAGVVAVTVGALGGGLL